MAQGRATAVLAVVVLLTGAGIVSVHRSQQQERENLHKGVIRDEQLRMLKQKELQSALEQSQT